MISVKDLAERLVELSASKTEAEALARSGSPGGGPVARIFSKLSQIFGSFCKFLDVFGYARTCLDPFGPVRMHSDAFGCVRMRSEAFGSFWKIWEFSRLGELVGTH